MVPSLSATTGFGMPALRSDWQPMMLRVRPAQFTTTSVSGSGAMSQALQARKRRGAREERVAAVVHALLAHVEVRDLPVTAEARLQIFSVDGLASRMSECGGNTFHTRSSAL